jgi:hypothetical protein
MPKSLSTQKVKQLFGDFSYTDLDGGRIKIDSDWIAENLVTVEIPQLAHIVTSTGGRISFHKKGAEQLRNAFEEVERKGLQQYILTWDGSWVARHIGWSKTHPLSRHSWGIAFDINVQWNGYSQTPAKENEHGTVRPLVEIFEAHGFCWGGTWSTPDGMHFEIAELNPVSQFVRLIINGVEVINADVIIRSNGRSYGLLGPMAKAMGIVDETVTSNDDSVPVAAFLQSHNYDVKWKAEGASKGTITANKQT